MVMSCTAAFNVDPRTGTPSLAPDQLTPDVIHWHQTPSLLRECTPVLTHWRPLALTGQGPPEQSMNVHSMLTAASLGPSVLHVSELRIPSGLVPATSLPVSSSINIGLEAICLDFRHTMFRPCQTHCPMSCHHDGPALHMPYYSVTACKSHINHTAQDAPLLIEPIPGMFMVENSAQLPCAPCLKGI